MRTAYIYIMTIEKCTTFYIGCTNDIEFRVLQHKSNTGSKFVSRYKLYKLVYYEELSSFDDAFEREQQLKNWHRQWKINLIIESNPTMKDLAKDWYTPEDIEEMSLNKY